MSEKDKNYFLQLIKDCLDGRERAQYELYKFLFPVLIKVTTRYTVNKEDGISFVNEAYLKIVTNLKDYDTSEDIERWARTITINTCIDHSRKNKRYKENVQLTEDYAGYEMEATHNNEGMQKMNADDIMKMISALPVVTKEVVNLFIVDEYSHKEIAKMLGITEENSRWHLHKGRQLLKEKLQVENEIDLKI